MNPSATGWIDKFFHRFTNEELVAAFATHDDFYHALRVSGFVYGHAISGLIGERLSELKLSKNEYSKVNLLHSFYFIYAKSYKNTPSIDQFLDHVLAFYNEIERGKISMFQRLSLGKSASKNLEKIISSRIQESDATIKKEGDYEFSNVLLATDVLTYLVYVEAPDQAKDFSDSLEEAIIKYCYSALQTKKHKDKYDTLLLDLFESSGIVKRAALPLSEFLIRRKDNMVQKYLLDLCCMAVKDDFEVEPNELHFINTLVKQLQLEKGEAQKALALLDEFVVDNKNSVNLFNQAHPVHHFYKQTSNTVERLILRNKKRLLKEITESGELLKLLGQSTLRDLDNEEKEKVKDQLLDIFKSIPSLTIFLLPGGTLLLPLFIKFIPKLLPSAFNENEIKD
ncbi:MAG: LETM1-related biofilm-associated protein [Gilvibacter sp.]